MRAGVLWAIVGLAASALAGEEGPPEGFTALFNGKDLAGWGARGTAKPEVDAQYAQHWKVENGVIKYDGKFRDLWTKKSFRDFVLRVDWRVPRHGTDSGICLRGSSKSQVNIWTWAMGSGEVWGYRTDKSLPEAVRRACTPVRNADQPVGQWNTFVITMRGEVLNVELNGEHVIVDARLPKVPAEGPLALQHHGSPLEFRNIHIKELVPEPEKKP